MTPPQGQGSLGPRAILQIRWGRQALRKAVLEPGRVLRVGRAEGADFTVPHDEHLAELHFQVSWTGNKCQLSDLKSGTPTLVHGAPVEEAELVHGSWVRAGTTDFMVYFEGARPPRPAGVPETAQALAAKERTLGVLKEQAQPLFAVLDAARDERILEVLQQSVEEYDSLYEGPQADALADVAPYLVHLPKGSRLLEALVQEGWGKSWGVYLTAEPSFTEVRRHLRKLLMVEADGQQARLYFRFYDPRVLRLFIPTCTPEQKGDFFGEIGSFFVESEDGQGCQQMAR